MIVQKPNRFFMYKNENRTPGQPSFRLYANINGQQYKLAAFPGVGTDEKIYYNGPITLNEEGEEERRR